MEKLTQDQIDAALADLTDWTQEGPLVVRTFRFGGFSQAVNFVTRVAEVAESMDHHPDIDIRYNKVSLRLSTHSAGGLTAADMELARRLEHIA